MNFRKSAFALSIALNSLGALTMTTEAIAQPARQVAGNSVQQRNAESVRTFLRRLEQMDIAGWAQLWAYEGRQDMPYAPPGFPAALVGKERLVHHFSGLPQAMEYMRFPDLQLHLTQDPNVVIAQFRGDIKVANSSKKYDNVYINLFRFRPDGKLVQVVEYFNPLVLIEGGAFENGAPKQAGAPAFDAQAFARDFFALVDTRDAQAIAAKFTPDISLRFGNRPQVQGRDAARASFAQTASALRAVKHELTGVTNGEDEQGPVVSAEANVTYTLADGREVTVPATSTLRLKDGLVRDYRIFIDTTPVFGN